jgi:DNA-binding transcriptional ArsR family regulator
MGENRREILEALSDDTRYAILIALSKKAMTGDEIAESVQRSRSTIEVHLSMLLRLGLVFRKRAERKYYYEATPAAQAWIGKVETPQGPLIHPKEASPVQYSPYRWLSIAILACVFYTLVNSFVIPLYIWLFSIFMGILFAWIIDSFRVLLESLVVLAIGLSVLSTVVAFGSFSLLSWILFLLVSLAFLLILGIPSWFLTKKVRNMFKKRSS